MDQPGGDQRASDVPGRLAIIGGGVVATEMATAYAGLGTDGDGDRPRRSLLTAAEPFAGERVTQALREAGVSVHLGRRGALGAAVTGDGTVHRRRSPTATRSTADEVLVATGRTPHTHDIGLDTVGLEPGRLARRSTTPCWRRCRRLATGCTPPATSTAGRC